MERETTQNQPWISDDVENTNEDEFTIIKM